MLRILVTLLSLGLPLALISPAQAANIDAILDQHVLPRVDHLADTATGLAETAQEHCAGTDPALRDAWATAFDAWIEMSHLRFGPTEVADRAFALAFWPDTRGATPKALAGLIASEDPAVRSEADFAQVSIAARGFYALEFLLYDPEFIDRGSDSYRCALVQAISTDTAAIATAIRDDWHGQQVDLMRDLPNATYRNKTEVRQEFFKALAQGLEMTSDVRLGRPMGTLDRPRPARAEVWRSGRSLRHVILSLESLRDLAVRLAAGDAQLADDLRSGFARAIGRAARLSGDPVFASVADPAGRFRVETLQADIDQIRRRVGTALAAELGVAAGFNASDGD